MSCMNKLEVGTSNLLLLLEWVSFVILDRSKDRGKTVDDENAAIAVRKWNSVTQSSASQEIRYSDFSVICATPHVTSGVRRLV